MGKSALMLVLVSLYSWSVVTTARNETILERKDEQALYEEKVLARERALSGFNIVVSNTENDINYRTNDGAEGYRDGSFSIVAIGEANGVTTVAATGTVGRAQYTIIGDMEQTGSAPLSALNIDGPIAWSQGNGNSYKITGHDTPVGHNALAKLQKQPTYGIQTTKGGVTGLEAMQAGMDGDQVLGKGINGENSFNHDDNMDLLNKIESNIRNATLCAPNAAFSSDCKTFIENSQRYTGNDQFGTPNNPVFMEVDGNVEFKGNVKGYGVLVVNGDFTTITGTPRWEGLIYVTKDGGHHELRGNPQIYGALIVRSQADELDEEGKAIKVDGAPMDFTIRGNAALHYSSEALDMIPSMIPAMLESAPSEITLTNVRQASGYSADYTSMLASIQ